MFSVFLEACDDLGLACRYFAEALNLSRHSEATKFLNGRVHVITVPSDGILTEQNSEEDRLFVVLYGTLKLYQVNVFLIASSF